MRHLVTLLRTVALVLVASLAVPALPAPRAVAADGCLRASAGRPWPSSAIASLTGRFTATTTARPDGTVDAVVALAHGAARTWADLAVVVRFNPSGQVDALDGTRYVGPGLRYAAATAYTVRWTVDVGSRTYSAWVTPQGGAEVLVGADLRFRSTQAHVTSLDTHVVASARGALTSCGFHLGGSGACLPARAGVTWPSQTAAPLTGVFTMTSRVVPHGVVDAAVGLSRGPARGWTQLAAVVRFGPAGQVDVRDGSRYVARTPVAYQPGRSHLVRVVVDTRSRRYSAWVTPPGRSEQLLAVDAAFRTEQSTVTSLDTVVAARAAGALDACDVTLTPRTSVAYRVETVAGGLDVPWDVAPTPSGHLIVPERAGRLLVVLPDGRVRQVARVRDLLLAHTAGLMSIALDPGFATNRTFYLCQSWTDGRRRDIRVVRWTIDPAWTSARRGAPVVAGIPTTTGQHAGCRLEVDHAGRLLIGTGDAAVVGAAQSRTSLAGKVLRVDRRTGAGVPGNPFATAGNANARRVLTTGHRNVQGLAVHPVTGALYEVEHGTARDDEVNRLVAGGDYGWGPGPRYDESQPMTDLRRYPAARRPVWSSGSPTVAASGATFVTHTSWGAWRGRLVVACLKGSQLLVLALDGNGAVVGQEHALRGYGRLRSVAQGPRGELYVTTSDGAGRDRVLRVTPA